MDGSGVPTLVKGLDPNHEDIGSRAVARYLLTRVVLRRPRRSDLDGPGGGGGGVPAGGGGGWLIPLFVAGTAAPGVV